MKVDEPFLDRAFLSTSGPKGRFAYDDNLRFRIESKTGRAVGFLNSTSLENEILFPDATRFLITFKKRLPDGTWEIGLREP